MTPALRFTLPAFLATALLHSAAFAQAPATPKPATATPAPKPKPTPPPVLDKLGIKLIPQPGVKIADADRAELSAGVAALGKEIDSLRSALKVKPDLLALLPDVLIFHKAVDWALRYDEFFNEKQVATAKKFLEMGLTRAQELRAGKPSWNAISGADTKPTADGKGTLPAMLVRGYVSKIDGSVQPYGIVLPEDYRPGEKTARRLDFWAHGRGETLSELDFLNQRLTNKGEFTPPGTIVLHLYGRYCNANKFAGEVDLFEALADAKKHYAIDDSKLVMRGFSMGGAAVWQFGTHFAGMFAVVQPGAGFAETREFNKVYAEGKTPPTWWEEVLYRWYDATDIVANLANTTTVAYSGEIDGQKQAADIMIRYARQDAGTAKPPTAELNKVNSGDGSPNAAEAKVTGTAPDVEFFHVIGPATPHKIQPEAKPEIEKLIDAALAKHEAVPKKVRFATYSLIYPRMEWVEIERMEKQWERAEIDASLTDSGVMVRTRNVAAFRVMIPAAAFEGKTRRPLWVDGMELELIPVTVRQQAVWLGAAHRENGKWLKGIGQVPPSQFAPGAPVAKIKEFAGPIDHAFMSSFLFVKPTGKPLNDKVGAWVTSEFDHAVGFWRKVFRGETPVKDDTAITDADIASSNLVLWGDPSSNAVLKKIADRLPIKWDAKKIVFAGQTYDAATTAPILIFPNPLNPTKYVVLNSGPTFREDALLNNSQQIPKLPDWAFIDVNTPADGKWPGKVLNAGFFDEQWQAPGK